MTKVKWLEHMKDVEKDHDRKNCPICIARRKTYLRNESARAQRHMVANLCGTSYTAAKRDMGL